MQTSKANSGHTGIPFTTLIVIVGTLLGIALLGIAALSSDTNLYTTLSIFSTRFLGIFIEAAPFLLLGSITSGLIEVFISREDVLRWIPRNPVLSTLSGTFMGMIFPVCECGVVPVARRLFKKGLPMSVGIAFLLAAPVMNPIVFASTYIAFGFGPVLIGRFVITAVIAMAVGLIVAYSARPQEVLLPASFAPVAGGDGTGGPAMPRKRRKSSLENLVDAVRYAGDEFFEMGRFLIVGCLLAAAMQTLVSQETLLAIGEGPIISVIAMQSLAFVLSVCSTVDAFLALAFTGTFTTGSILSFLSFGPMVDIKSTLMFLGVFKRRTVLYMIVLPFLMSLLIGVWINLAMGYF